MHKLSFNILRMQWILFKYSPFNFGREPVTYNFSFSDSKRLFSGFKLKEKKVKKCKKKKLYSQILGNSLHTYDDFNNWYYFAKFYVTLQLMALFAFQIWRNTKC